MKKLSAALLITTCTALCALVWPQTEQPENTPIEPEPPAVSVEIQPPTQPEPILTMSPIAAEAAPIAEKE